MKQVNFTTLLWLFLLPIHAVFANQSFSNLDKDRYALGLDLGYSKTANLNNSASFPLGYSTFIYNGEHDNASSWRYSISLNKNINLNSLYILQTGVGYHSFTDMSVKGDLQQGISKPYYDSTYHYSIYSYQLLVEATLLRKCYERFYPYITAGIGGAENKAQNFSTAVPDYLTLTPYFSNKTTHSFSYNIGLGLNYFISPKVSFGLGYRFSDLGSVGLGQGSLNTEQVPEKFQQSNLYLNTLLLQLNCLIT